MELQPSRRRADPDESYTVPSALRLIRLLFKYGVMLKSTLEEGFGAVHVRPFEAIIPQLSARLSHPEPFVRTQVSRLLTRIASTTPLSIIHYALVGPESAMATEETRAVFAVILAPIAAGNPELVSETKRTIAEFNRMTVLWEEMWLNMIMKLQPVAGSLLQEVSDLLASSKDGGTADVASVYSSVMHPLVSAIRPLFDATSGPCASNHERWFQKEFGSRLASAFDRLQHPVAAYDDGWERFMEILRDLTRIVHRSRTLRMEDLSPFLSEMKISNFIIPAAQVDPPVTLYAFRSRVEVLPTKTKPKKITMVGSDGKDHLYFLKGHEDLRLDERVMQFHDVTNQLLKRKHCTAKRGLRMENYAVFPLSDKSGMIECIENTTSIFSVYRRWQDREFTARTEAAAAAAEKNPSGGSIEEVLRPNDMFNRKLVAALRREELEVKSRSQVPGRVFVDVFRELLQETPGDLLKNEFLCCAPTALEFWRRTTTFARSVAVSSMIGYVLGLGDRHLDNILVNFEEGTVLNIDYNICFDKGKVLRIPETVPFRMTQNLENAMGVSGIDGDFTASSEHAMAVLRDNREILCAVLEAFVYDPLVDWTDRRNLEAVGDADDNAADEGGPFADAEGAAADADGGEQSEMLSQPTEGENENAVPQNAPGAIAPGRSERLAKAPGKNAQAMAVLRRVHATLEGRAEDSQRRMSISQQVEGAIREATSLTNLAYMYEGWAAWV